MHNVLLKRHDSAIVHSNTPAALCAVHECNDPGPSLALLQFGVGVSGVVDGVGHAARSTLHSHPDHLLLSLKCKYTCTSTSRQAIYHGAQKHAPTLLHYLSWAYGSASRVFLQGAPHDSSSVLSTSRGTRSAPSCSHSLSKDTSNAWPRHTLQLRSSLTLTT
jgi:hypothetical protein